MLTLDVPTQQPAFRVGDGMNQGSKSLINNDLRGVEIRHSIHNSFLKGLTIEDWLIGLECTSKPIPKLAVQA
jgi:hypothetical protein